MPPEAKDTLDPKPRLRIVPRARRALWLAAMIAAAVMLVAAWQLRPSPSRFPTAGEALNGSAGSVLTENARGFEVPLHDGTVFDLDDHLSRDGRPVLLNLWASWCIPCRNEMPLIDDAAPLFPGVAFLGVAVNDSRSDAERFVDEIGVSYAIGFDDDGAVIDGYPAPAMPVTYVIDGSGKVRARFFGELTVDKIEELLTGVS